MYDLIILGGGPSALGALSYARAKQLHVLMIYEDLGGKTAWHHVDRDSQIAYEELVTASPGKSSGASGMSARLPGESHLAGVEIVRMLEQEATTGHDHIMYDRVERVSRRQLTLQVATAAHGALQCAAVLVATGASAIQLALPGVHTFAGLRLRYSLTTYAPLTVGKRIVVVAATRRALQGAAECARRAEHVTLVVPNPDVLASELGQRLRQRSNVELLVDFEATAVESSNEGDLLRITGPGGERTVLGDMIFVDVGVVPNSAIVKSLVSTDEEGFIRISDSYATDVVGVFAAGDVTTHFPEQILGCIGAGAMAAQSAYEYLLTLWLAADVPHVQKTAWIHGEAV